MRLKVCVLLAGTLLLAWGLSLAADPPYYLRKATWSDTLMESRQALVRHEAEEAKRPKAEPEGGVRLGTWYAIGPFPKKGTSAFSDVFPPEQEVDLSKQYGSFRWVVHPEWRDGVVHDLTGTTDLATYLTRTITVPAPTKITGYFGSDDGLVVWLNGKRLISNDTPRGPAPNQDKAELDLVAGENRLLLKIHNRSGGYGFYFSTSPKPAVQDPRAEARNGLWALLERDFNDPEARRLMVWERADGIWSEDWQDGDLGALARRYAAATRDPQLKAEATRLAGSVKSPADLAAVRALYARARALDEGITALRALSTTALRLAIEDLNRSFGSKYPNGAAYLRRLDALENSRKETLDALAAGNHAVADRAVKLAAELSDLRREALLANPLLDFDRLLLVKRKENRLGLPANWQGNSSIARTGYDNEIAILSPIRPDGKLTTLYRPEGGRFVGDLDLHFDADRMLFSMPAANGRWQVFEIRADGTGLQQKTPGDQPDVDNYDGCYLPNGKLIYLSTACFQGVPCVAGGDHVSLLYLMDQTGKVRQLTFDQDHNWCPTVLNSGRVMYTRWEYSDTPHYFTRILFHMNPDGTEQMELYGSNSYWPNSLFFARPIPNHPSKVVSIVSGHHGVPRMGELVIFDPTRGRREAAGAVQRIPGYGKPVEPVIVDELVNNTWPRFLHPWPLSDKYFLVSCKPSPTEPWGIYLVDIFDNIVPIRALDGYALLEPIPLRKRPTPPSIPEKAKPDQKDAVIYLSDIYAGDGLKGVPRGSVKALRVYANHYAYPRMGGHINIGIDGPWDVKRILGTVPVHSDGSAMFRAPANTPLVVQPLDSEGKALQQMRSWMTAMPGETLSCVGCHESQNTPPRNRGNLAARTAPVEIQPWRGPVRGFSFEREVQPVLDKYCVSCHNGAPRADGKSVHNLRGLKDVPGYKGKFTPSYEVLHRYVRRPGPESDYHMLAPLEYHADTSELVQMLQKGHYGVKLDAEAWDRLITWIDLNVPCHGTWREHRPIPGAGDQRRRDLRKLYTGMDDDPEAIPASLLAPVKPVAPAPVPPRATPVTAPGWPYDAAEAKKRQAALGVTERTVDLGNGVKLTLVRVPAGECVIGDTAGASDEQPQARVRIDKPFWIGRFEVTNAQYRLFDPGHDSGYASWLNKDQTQRGYPMNEPEQPVTRVAWARAMAFCQWLSQKTGEKFTLPTEAQWEYACRAGTGTPLSYGDVNTDFSRFANLADATLKRYFRRDSPDWFPKDDRYSDGALVTTKVGSYAPNAWGLHDMHGNVAEWTRTTAAAYPYRGDDGRDSGDGSGRKVVRGGSWFDRPERARSAFRLSYPTWQRVYNVGFRVVCEEK